MKKKIAILGSTGSIGKTLLNIIKQNKNEFEVVLLSAEENDKEVALIDRDIQCTLRRAWKKMRLREKFGYFGNLELSNNNLVLKLSQYHQKH